MSFKWLVLILIGFFVVLPGAIGLAGNCIDVDCNGNGQVDIDDIVLYINYIFGGVTAVPCAPCTDVLEVGNSYIVYDTTYQRSGVFAVGDSLFSYLYRWVLKDSIHIKSVQHIRRTNLDGWMISDTAYLGAVEYWLGLPDSGGVTGGGFIGFDYEEISRHLDSVNCYFEPYDSSHDLGDGWIKNNATEPWPGDCN